MNKATKFKTIGTLVTVISFVLTQVAGWAADKEQDAIIEDKITLALEDKQKETADEV